MRVGRVALALLSTVTWSVRGWRHGELRIMAACESTSIARPRRVRWRDSASAGHPDIGPIRGSSRQPGGGGLHTPSAPTWAWVRNVLSCSL